MTEQLAAIPEFQALGPLFKSSEPVQLTEAETEYVVRCIKHTFSRHMVFQFDCTNTLNDQLLQKVPAGQSFLLFVSKFGKCNQVEARNKFDMWVFVSGDSTDGTIRGV